MKLVFRNTDSEAVGEKGSMVVRTDVKASDGSYGVDFFIEGDQSQENIMTPIEVTALIQFLQLWLNSNVPDDCCGAL